MKSQQRGKGLYRTASAQHKARPEEKWEAMVRTMTGHDDANSNIINQQHSCSTNPSFGASKHHGLLTDTILGQFRHLRSQLIFLRSILLSSSHLLYLPNDHDDNNGSNNNVTITTIQGFVLQKCKPCGIHSQRRNLQLLKRKPNIWI